MFPFSTLSFRQDHLLLPTPQTTTTHSRRLCVLILKALSHISFEFGLCRPSPGRLPRRPVSQYVPYKSCGPDKPNKEQQKEHNGFDNQQSLILDWNIKVRAYLAYLVLLHDPKSLVPHLTCTLSQPFHHRFDTDLIHDQHRRRVILRQFKQYHDRKPTSTTILPAVYIPCTTSNTSRLPVRTVRWRTVRQYQYGGPVQPDRVLYGQSAAKH